MLYGDFLAVDKDLRCNVSGTNEHQSRTTNVPLATWIAFSNRKYPKTLARL
jgi:uncharacterized protein YktB (UPF0637 family)